MVNNVVHATYTETYDLNTAVNELSILGIHTPTAPQLKKMFAGFFLNYRKMKILGCNFRMVCASQQSLDPSQLGLEAGQVDPRDVLNPILFKACTGESLNALLDVVYGDSNISYGTEPSSLTQHVTKNSSAINAYYQLLADDSFRKSHPQAGLTVEHLVPKVHKIVSTRPFHYSSGTGVNGTPLSYVDSDGADYVGTDDSLNQVHTVFNSGTSAPTVGTSPTYLISNGLADMPSFDTTYPWPGTTASPSPETVITSSIPRVYMGVLVLPPAILQRLFFRLQIVWHVEFTDFRPVQDVGGISSSTVSILTGLGTNSNSTYFNIYHNASASKLDKEFSSFDVTDNVEVGEVNQVAK